MRLSYEFRARVSLSVLLSIRDFGQRLTFGCYYGGWALELAGLLVTIVFTTCPLWFAPDLYLCLENYFAAD
jgi:hypothetical protein